VNCERTLSTCTRFEAKLKEDAPIFHPTAAETPTIERGGKGAAIELIVVGRKRAARFSRPGFQASMGLDIPPRQDDSMLRLTCSEQSSSLVPMELSLSN